MGRQQVVGELLLALVAVGLAAYVFWRLAQGLLDLDRKGGDLKGLLVRAGYVGSGLAYAGLAVTAAGMALGSGGGGGGDNVRTWTGLALADPDRWWLVAAVGRRRARGAGCTSSTRPGREVREDGCRCSRPTGTVGAARRPHRPVSRAASRSA